MTGMLIGFAAIVPHIFGDQGLFSHHIYRVRPKHSVGLSLEFVVPPTEYTSYARNCKRICNRHNSQYAAIRCVADSLGPWPLRPDSLASSALIAESARLRQKSILLAESQFLATQLRMRCYRGWCRGRLGQCGT